MSDQLVTHAKLEEPVIVRDTPDAKWRLLEINIESRKKSGATPEVILIGDSFSEEFLSTAQSLARTYSIQIRHAHNLSVSSPVHAMPTATKPQGYRISAATALVQSFFHGNGSPTTRKFYQRGLPRWSARARRDFSYIRQFGQFPQDFAFWRKQLSAPDSVRLSKGENRIQFRLHSSQDYERFLASVKQLHGVQWAGLPDVAADDTDL